jgi:polysaccharide pyruvyl transferase WcaK-like protein
VSARRLRVGLFGLLGSGNIGNDASVEAIMRYLRAEYPDATVDAMCMGWKRVRDRYGIVTTPLLWQQEHLRPGLPGKALAVLGKVLDSFRTAGWVRGHDVVIIPGMGILDPTLPLNPWGVPLAVFQLAAWGRLFGAKVALVAVGADKASARTTQWLYNRTARLAAYVSFRDESSRKALQGEGVDVSAFSVHPDLVWTIPVTREEPEDPTDPKLVAVGVMAYYGGQADRGRSAEVYASYTESVAELTRWLLGSGHDVRLFYGDEVDRPALDKILADVRSAMPGLAPERLTAYYATRYEEVTALLGPVAAVVATRFHNVMFALKLAKPTIALSYARKIDSMMADLGLSEYCLPAGSIDIAALKALFTEVQTHRDEISREVEKVVAEHSQAARAQLAELSTVLFKHWPLMHLRPDAALVGCDSVRKVGATRRAMRRRPLRRRRVGLASAIVPVVVGVFLAFAWNMAGSHRLAGDATGGGLAPRVSVAVEQAAAQAWARMTPAAMIQSSTRPAAASTRYLARSGPSGRLRPGG